MAVTPHHGERLVTEDLGDLQQARAAHRQVESRTVPQIVKLEVLDAGGSERLPSRKTDVDRSFAVRPREQQGRVDPPYPRELLHDLGGVTGERYRPPLPVLGLMKDQPAARQVDIGLGQPEQLHLSRPGRQGEEHHRIKEGIGARLARRKQTLAFIAFEHTDTAMWLRQLGPAGACERRNHNILFKCALWTN